MIHVAGAITGGVAFHVGAAMILVGQSMGRGDVDEAKRVVGTAIGAAVGAAATVIPADRRRVVVADGVRTACESYHKRPGPLNRGVPDGTQFEINFVP